MSHRIVLGSALLAASACTGVSFGENNPDDGSGPDLGTYLEGGSIAVDGLNENVYVLTREDDDTTGEVVDKSLMIAPPSATQARRLARLTSFGDLRLLFVDGAVMVMGERGGYDELILYDRAGTREIRRQSTGARYHGTRISDGGEFVAVGDNSQSNTPIHVIRVSDLSIREIPHDGDWLEANWANHSDRLLAAVFYDGAEGELGSLRLLSWSIKSLSDSAFPEANGFWANPLFDVSLPETGSDPLFSYSWITVSPDDSTALVPMVQRDGKGANRYRLAVVTLATGAVRMVDDARGPAGFTPDGTTIVSYRSVQQEDGEVRPHLLLLDSETLEEELMDEPSPGLIQYFITRDGNYVVVGDFFGSSELTLVDLDNGTSSNLGRAIDLHEFVSRPGTGEMYLVDQGLFRLDVFDATLEEENLDFVPEHINRLPSDQLVVDHPAAKRLEFLDPDSAEIVRSVDL
jgi:hypothetical protein